MTDDDEEHVSSDGMTPLQMAAVQLHEFFVALVDAGFYEEQALSLVSAKMVADSGYEG